MAFLLLVYEKMRLQRKVNKLTLRQTQLSSRKERIAKNIEKVQKMYSSKITNAEKQAQLWASQAKNSIFNSMGLGMQNQMFNPMGGYSGITSFVANQMASMLANGGNGIPTKYDKDGNATEFCNDFKDGTLYSRMMQDYYGGGFQAVYDENNKSQITGYKVEESIGYPTPGSFGTYCGIERNIPTITLELPEKEDKELLWNTNKEIFDYLTSFDK